MQILKLLHCAINIYLIIMQKSCLLFASLAIWKDEAMDTENFS